MADFEHRPIAPGYRIEHTGPVILRSEFEDGGLVLREKTVTSKRLLVGEFHVGASVAKTILDQFDTKGFDTTLTVLTWDVQAADPDTDSATCYYWTRPFAEYMAPYLYKILITFREA